MISEGQYRVAAIERGPGRYRVRFEWVSGPGPQKAFTLQARDLHFALEQGATYRTYGQLDPAVPQRALQVRVHIPHRGQVVPVWIVAEGARRLKFAAPLLQSHDPRSDYEVL